MASSRWVRELVLRGARFGSATAPHKLQAGKGMRGEGEN
jgi:hypothetical protein